MALAVNFNLKINAAKFHKLVTGGIENLWQHRYNNLKVQHHLLAHLQY